MAYFGCPAVRNNNEFAVVIIICKKISPNKSIPTNNKEKRMNNKKNRNKRCNLNRGKRMCLNPCRHALIFPLHFFIAIYFTLPRPLHHTHDSHIALL